MNHAAPVDGRGLFVSSGMVAPNSNHAQLRHELRTSSFDAIASRPPKSPEERADKQCARME
jgi:hypothetical protein